MDDSTAAVSAKAPYARRTAVALAGAALVAGLLTACGSSGSTGSAASPSASATASASPSPSASPTAAGSAPASTPPSPGASAQPSAQPTSPGIAVGERPPTAVKIPATGYRQDSPTQLTVFFTAGVCDKYGVRVEEDNPPVVKLRVVITQTAEPGKVCPQLIKEQQASVTLSKPMTGGSVVDTATGDQVPPQNGIAGGDPR